ncbi:MAG: Mutator MutT protein [Candidatus Woesebacteria bacterium GW2011_GWB1_43_14]|uniref:Mutator MutT protein n=1 Tax=Candidatus Woesebacteria bacterium GW2011_GWB1_43_14 TaxID=1618578 RepID=A0A0G1GJ49_9BACT|nr:MAG: Mutator MutT protein [Candidatus Woesebacteria bacterium GW2011_GWC1_42_9]KKS98788.1 MAG: Mutator MutT protein [Candidatus Woesebacteria bacterium GW2011_GWB1_43_14]
MVIDKVLIIASAIIKNGEQKILLLKRGKTKTFQGNWQLPEGKLEVGEKPQDALRRELKEELGAGVDTLTLENVSQSTLEAKGTKYLAFRIIFKVKLKENKITLSSEHSDYRWVNTTDIPSMVLLPGTMEAISGN